MENKKLDFNLNPKDFYNTLTPREYYANGKEGILLAGNKIQELKMKFFMPFIPMGKVKLDAESGKEHDAVLVYFLDNENIVSCIVVKNQNLIPLREVMIAIHQKFNGDLLKGCAVMKTKPQKNNTFGFVFDHTQITENDEATINLLKQAQKQAVELGVSSPTLNAILPKFNPNKPIPPANYLEVFTNPKSSLLSLTA